MGGLEQLRRPGGLPFVGNALQLRPRSVHLQLEEWAAELGPAFVFSLWGRPVLVLSDPASIMAVLRDRPEAFRRMAAIESVLSGLGVHGVFSAEGDDWRPQRVLVARALARGQLKAYYPTVAAVAGRLLARWRENATRDGVTDLVDDFGGFAVDVVSSLSLGYDINTLQAEEDEIRRHMATLFPALHRRLLSPVPYWRWIRLPADRRADRAVEALTERVDQLISDARTDLAERRDPEPRNLLEALIVAAAEEDSPIDDDELRSNVITMLVAGEDTTSNSLAWTCLELAQRPSLQDRLYDNAREVLGDQLVPADMETVGRLDAFEAVASEAARFRPVAPFLFLEANTDTSIDGLAVDAGTMVWTLLRPAMLDDGHFADPDRFDHSRWIEAPGQRTHDPSAFLQFGAGPRVCPGRQLAQTEFRTALAVLMRSFSLTLVDEPQAVAEELAFTMAPSSARVRLTPRPT